MFVNKGLSLVELLIAVGVLAILMILLTTIFLSQSQNFEYQQTKLLLEGYFEIVLATIKNFVSAADSILSNQNIQGTDYTSGAETLVLRLPSIDSAKKTIAGQYDYAAIFKSGSDIKIVLSPSAQSIRKLENRVLAQYVSWVNFDYGDLAPNLAKTVLFSMTLSKTASRNQIITITRSLQATLRNKL